MENMALLIALVNPETPLRSVSAGSQAPTANGFMAVPASDEAERGAVISSLQFREVA